MDALRAWARQPTTVAGTSAILGTVIAVLLRQISWWQAVPLLAGAVASVLLPDNSGARQQAEGLATGLLNDIAKPMEHTP